MQNFTQNGVEIFVQHLQRKTRVAPLLRDPLKFCIKKKRGKTPLLVGNILNSVPDFEALGRRRPKRTGLALGIRTGTVNILADTYKHGPPQP